jgi:hypothetical protein
MTDLSPLGGSSGGVWTRTHALQLVTPAVVRSALRSGAWRVVWPGVYADGGYELTAEQRCWAAVLASGGAGPPVPWRGSDDLSARPRFRLRAVACGRTAARLWGLPLVDDEDPATGACERVLDDVAVWSHLPAVHHEGWLLRRHRLHLNAEDLVRTATGLYITSPLRTLVHCCRLLAPEAAVCMLDHALHSGLVQRADLVRAVEARAGSPGVDDLRRAVSYADGRAESCAETLTRLLVLPVVPGLEPQVELRDDRGLVVARFDLADRARRFAVETDGKAGHSGPVMVAKDRARDVRTERYGWCTERVTWFDVRRRQRETLDRLTYRVAVLDRRSG